MNKTLAVLPALLVLFFLPARTAGAQTAAELDRIIALPVLNYADAAWLIFSAAGTIAPETSPPAAYRYAAGENPAGKNFLPFAAEPDKPATLGGASLLIMGAFNFPGGLRYTLAPGPRSAFRELVYRKLIAGRAYSTLPVSGERLLRIISRVLDYAGEAETPPAETPNGGNHP
jgi:hypothetical protein